MKKPLLTKTVLSTEEEKIKKLLLTQCKVAVDQYKKGNIIWRGVKNIKMPILLVDSTKVTRKAANTFNAVNLYVSNAPEWSAFPPRNKSLICSSARFTADTYAGILDPFVVLPIGDPLIGMCPKMDFWPSFKFDVSDFSDELYYNFWSALKAEKLTKRKVFPDTLYEDFLKFCNEIDKLSPMQKKEILSWDTTSVTKKIVKNGLLPVLKYYFSPKNFKLTKMSSYNPLPNKEVWVSGKCVLIRPKLLVSLVGKHDVN